MGRLGSSCLIFFLASWTFFALLIISLFIFIMVSEPTINLFFIFILLALSFESSKEILLGVYLSFKNFFL